MARNFEGLGVGIEVDDGGSTKKLKSLGRTVDDLWDGLKKAGSVAPKLGQAFSRGLGTIGAKGGQAFGAITMAMGTMIDKATSPELDNAYSSMYAGFNKSFSALTAGMNTSKKELADARKAIGGAAFGMGEDMDQAAENWVHFEKQGVALNEILGTKGLTSTVKGLIKVTSVYEIQGEQLAAVMGSLVKGFNFTEKSVGSLADKIVASGKVFNMGKEAIQAWPAILESLNNELADFGKTLSPQEIEKLTLSIVQLGGGLKEALGLAPQQAIELARTMFTTIAGERKNIINMFRGMGGEFGDVAKGLMEAGGDVNQMFELMSKGDPLKFMDTLRAMSKEAEKRGGETGMAFQRLSGVMTEALGPDIAFAMKGNWDKASEAMANIPDALKGSEGMFKNIADEHWKSSITAGEAWDRMIEGMKARLHKLSAKDVNKWKVGMQKGFEDTFQAISKLAADDGPLGELTRKMLTVQRVGLTALIPSLSGLAPLLGGVASASLPVLTAMGSMGLTFSSLGSMALKGGVLFGLFYLLKEGPTEAIKNIKKMASDIWTSLGEMFPDLKKRAEGFFNWLTDTDMEAVVSGWFKDIDIASFFSELAEGVGGIQWGKIASQVMGAAKGLLKGIGGLISSLAKEIDWGDLIKNVASFIGDALAAIGGGIVSFLSDLFSDPEAEGGIEAGITTTLYNAFIGAFGLVKDMLIGAVGGLFSGLFGGDEEGEGGGLEKFGKVMIGVLAGLLIFSKKFRAAFVPGLVGAAKAGMGGMAKIMKTQSRLHSIVAKKGGMGIVKAYRVQFQHLGRVAKRGMKKLGGVMRKGGKMLGGASLFFGLIEGLKQVGKRMESISDVMSDKLVPDFAKTSIAGKEAFRGITDTVDAAFMGMPGMIGKALGISSQSLNDFYYDMVGGAEKAFAWVHHGFMGMVNGMSIGWDTFKNVVVAGWEYIKKSAVFVGKSLKAVWTDVVTHMEGAFDTFVTAFERIFMSMGNSLKMGFFKLQGMIVGIIDKIPKGLLEAAGMGSLAKFSASFRAYSKSVGGEKGLAKILKKKEREFERDVKEKEDKRKEERLVAQREKAKAGLEMLSAGLAVGKAYKEGDKKQKRAAIKNVKDLDRTLDDINKSTAKTKEESAEYAEREAKAAKKKGRAQRQAAVEEEKSDKRKRKGKGKVGTPTTEERVQHSERMIVKDMFKVIEGQQAEMVRRTDLLTKAVNNINKSPIDAYVTVEMDGAKVSKGLKKHELRKAGGRGH